MGSGNLYESLWKQELSVRKMVLDGERSGAEYHRILQGIIADDDFQIIPKSVANSRVFPVVGNYTSAAAAIEAGNYPVKWGLAENPEKIPLIIQPVDCRVRAVPLGRVVKVREMFGLYPRMVDPMACFTFGALFAKEQENAPHITVWKDSKGRFWYADLYVYDGERDVGVREVDPEFEIGEGCLVLVRE